MGEKGGKTTETCCAKILTSARTATAAATLYANARTRRDPIIAMIVQRGMPTTEKRPVKILTSAKRTTAAATQSANVSTRKEAVNANLVQRGGSTSETRTAKKLTSYLMARPSSRTRGSRNLITKNWGNYSSRRRGTGGMLITTSTLGAMTRARPLPCSSRRKDTFMADTRRLPGEKSE